MTALSSSNMVLTAYVFCLLLLPQQPIQVVCHFEKQRNRRRLQSVIGRRSPHSYENQLQGCFLQFRCIKFSGNTVKLVAVLF